MWPTPFPPWEQTRRDERGEPLPPPWLAQDLATRGGRFSTITRVEPKARHGRQETRRLWALADPDVNQYVGSGGTAGRAWPAVQQVIRVERWREVVRGGQVVKTTQEVSYAITSVPAAQAEAPQLLRWLRGHWGIENKIHYVRDVTFGEDAAQVRTGAAPQVLAACRNLALTCLRRAGYDNIAAALRTFSGRPPQAVQLVLEARSLVK